MNFFRSERDFILKEAPPKLGQKISMPSIGPGGDDIPAALFSKASDYYYYDDPSVPATQTVASHLEALRRLLQAAEQGFT